jgi:Family of unknown function (DUF6614)
MNKYHARCDLKPGVRDVAFSEGASKYLTHLQAKGMIESWRITRRKLGLGQPEIDEFLLQGAASIAGLLITTEAMVAELPKKQSPAMPPGGGMGGMGGMGF